MRLEFTKMHGIGNDYIYINCLDKPLENPNELSAKLSHRRFSIGSDGLIMICRSETCDAFMRMFNSDGTEGEMCGNAIRCVGKYLYDNGIINKNTVTIETKGGIKILKLAVENDKVSSVTVDMGIAVLEPSKIPTTLQGKSIVGYPLVIDGNTYPITCVSMGNPHTVAFFNDIDSLDLESLGPKFENNSIFPQRVNTEFIRIIDRTTLQMRVWERGSGETFACGTGACASAVAAALENKVDYEKEITVKLIGGELYITVMSDLRVFMRGSATTVFTGNIDI